MYCFVICHIPPTSIEGNKCALRSCIPQTMEYEGIIDHFNPILPNAGILPFNGLETARELDEVYERVLPFDLTQTRHGPMFQNGNWFAGAIKRRRRAEIKASRTISLDSISRALILPTELLLEIFEFLYPIDLYSVIRSTKRLRSTLLDRGASSVWKEAFNRCSDVLPACPPDISEPRWASILFGPATCDVSCFTIVFKNLIVGTVLRAKGRHD